VFENFQSKTADLETVKGPGETIVQPTKSPHERHSTLRPNNVYESRMPEMVILLCHGILSYIMEITGTGLIAVAGAFRISVRSL
jgi:hypothetical protein